MARKRLPHFDAPGLVQHVVFCTRGAYRSDEDDEALGRSPHGRILTGAASDVVQDVLLRRRGEGHWLHAWCVMPNHVHVLVEVRGAPLPSLVAAWKSVSSREVNALLKRTGALWQPNYFDRFMRDEEQFGATKDYIERNPVVAGLAADARDWRWSSAWRA